MAKSFEIKGMKEALREIKSRVLAVGSGSKTEVEKALRAIERDAKRNAPVDESGIVGGISHEITDGGYNGIVTSSATHSPFMEFGTGTKVHVPAGWEDAAKEFKGYNPQNENGKSFLEAIKDWCKRHGIPEEAAFPIMLKIYNVGVEPRPFLIPAYLKNIPGFIARMKKVGGLKWR